jgi:hypothetical protein
VDLLRRKGKGKGKGREEKGKRGVKVKRQGMRGGEIRVGQ